MRHMIFRKFALIGGWGMVAVGIAAVLILSVTVDGWSRPAIIAGPTALAAVGVGLALVAGWRKRQRATAAGINKDKALEKRRHGMTTWDRETAKRVYDALRDVDFYIAQARVCIGEGFYDLAKERIKAAVAAKFNAMRRIPAAENAMDDLGVDFVDLYELRSRKDDLAWGFFQITELPPPQRSLYTSYELIAEQVQTIIGDMERMRDKFWPAPDVCAERFDEIIAMLRQLHAAVTANPPTADGIDVGEYPWMRTVEVALFNCIYPDSQVDMGLTYIDLWMLDSMLESAYGWAKIGRGAQGHWPEHRADLYLTFAEHAKYDLQKSLREAFPGIETGFPPPLGEGWDAPNPYAAGSEDLPEWPEGHG